MQKLNLAALKPSEVGRAGAELRPGAGAALAADLRALTRYAQHGEGLFTRVEDQLRRVMSMLFAKPGQLDFNPLHAKIATPDEAAAPAAAMVTIVLRAARGRVRLARENVIDAPDLAVLVELDDSFIRRLARNGKLARVGGASSGRRAPITRPSAERLLSERKVAPFGAS